MVDDDESVALALSLAQEEATSVLAIDEDDALPVVTSEANQDEYLARILQEEEDARAAASLERRSHPSAAATASAFASSSMSARHVETAANDVHSSVFSAWQHNYDDMDEEEDDLASIHYHHMFPRHVFSGATYAAMGGHSRSDMSEQARRATAALNSASRPEDAYEALLALDETVVKRGVDDPDAVSCRMRVDASMEEKYRSRECPICLDAFTCGQVVRILPCMDMFHQNCIDQHFRSSTVCPVCQGDVEEMSRKRL